MDFLTFTIEQFLNEGTDSLRGALLIAGLLLILCGLITSFRDITTNLQKV